MRQRVVRKKECHSSGGRCPRCSPRAPPLVHPLVPSGIVLPCPRPHLRHDGDHGQQLRVPGRREIEAVVLAGGVRRRAARPQHDDVVGGSRQALVVKRAQVDLLLVCPHVALVPLRAPEERACRDGQEDMLGGGTHTLPGPGPRASMHGARAAAAARLLSAGGAVPAGVPWTAGEALQQ